MLEIGKEAVIEIGGRRGSVVVRGWRSGEGGYLLTEKPAGQVPPISIGGDAVIRMQHSGILFGAAVKYEDFLKKTGLCLFSFHDEMMARSMRDQERLACMLPASVKAAEGPSVELGRGVIVDVSTGGAKFISPKPLTIEPGDTVLLSFCPGGMGFIDRQGMKVLRTAWRGGQFECGGTFCNVEKANLKLLESYFGFWKSWAA